MSKATNPHLSSNKVVDNKLGYDVTIPWDPIPWDRRGDLLELETDKSIASFLRHNSYMLTLYDRGNASFTTSYDYTIVNFTGMYVYICMYVLVCCLYVVIIVCCLFLAYCTC